MRHTVFEDAIPLDVCKYIKDFFDSREDLHVKKPNNPNVIKINSPWTHLKDVLDPILSKYFKTIKGQGGNIYKHSNLYTTHVDSEEPWQLINCLLPIYLPDPTIDQRFIVFDQWVDNGFGQTWYGDRDDIKYDFDRNKILQSTPFTDERVYDKTDKDIDTAFYEDYLKDNNYSTKKSEKVKDRFKKASKKDDRIVVFAERIDTIAYLEQKLKTYRYPLLLH